MLLIRCTAKLQKEMGLKPKDLFSGEPARSILGPWHANLIYINRRKCVLFVNDRTLFNFIVLDVPREKIKRLGELFLSFLHPVLPQEGISACLQERIATEYADVAFGKAQDRSVLGSMNDLALHYEDYIVASGGVHSVAVPEIISKLNRMPMGAIDYQYPADALTGLCEAARRMSARN